MSYLFLAAAAIMALIRLSRGPSLADRVVALDVLALIGIAVLALLAIQHDRPALLDVAVVMSLVTFVGTVAFAAAIERRNRP